MQELISHYIEIDIDFPNIALTVLFVNVIFLIKISRKKAELKWFTITLIGALFIEIFARIVAYRIGNNLPLLHLHTLLEFIFISLFYREILFKKYAINRYFPYFIGLVSIVIVANSIFLQPLTGYNSNAKGLSQCLIIIYSILYFFNRISVEVSRTHLILNQINASILLYYAGSLFIFGFASFLSENSPQMNTYFWRFNALLYLIFQLLVLITTWNLVFPNLREVKKEN